VTPAANEETDVSDRGEHHALVELGARHIRRVGFPVVATELRAWGSREEADVIAFRTHTSALIEAKCSRADFFADARKPERSAGGLGVYRFYLCPAGLIEPDEVPCRWGLLWAERGKVRQIKGPEGNHWPPYDPAYRYGNWSQFMHEPDLKAERAVMYSIARRRSLSRSDEQYEARLAQANRRADQLARSNDALAAELRDLQLKLALAVAGRTAAVNDAGQVRAAIRRRISKAS